MPPAKATVKVDLNAKPTNKKIVFDDEGEGEVVEVSTAIAAPKRGKRKTFTDAGEEEEILPQEDDQETNTKEDEEEDYFAKRDRQRMEKKQKAQHEDDDVQTKWFHVYPQFPSSAEVLDMKDTEQMELYNNCKGAFEAETPNFQKRNPTDARWLQTALHKGTAKDRANAGALLVTSNPLGNLEALATLVGFTKMSNKSSTEVVGILTDLWKEVLLPPHRKLISLQLRGADWKQVRKDAHLTKEQQRRIYAYWHFENELKEHYFDFLKNLQQGMQTGQENNKTSSIVCAAQLLAFAPEKEQMLLSMVVNKLGDPIAKIASKALHHLAEVAQRHPNMCGVIVTETEKLLFRNNISDRAQHFALCFLASMAPAGRPEVCTKLVNICFALFKVLVQRGAVNNRTMQAILRCLQNAILEAKPAEGTTEILSKDMQDTVYRLVHLADIRIAVQTLGLLLQLITVKTEKSDRFYNALYKKLLSTELATIGTKTAAQLLHIVHRAVHIDRNVQRSMAFVKRLLQVALQMPPNIAAGCLIVLHKLLRTRRELAAQVKGATDVAGVVNAPKVSAEDADLARFDSDGEEKYEDIDVTAETLPNDEKDETLDASPDKKEEGGSSWHHVAVAPAVKDQKAKDMVATKYDPFHRVPAFAGAEFALRNELILLCEHFHPTVQVFATNILNNKRIDYYGDPLRDFGLPHFLERFAFKNPKKVEAAKAEAPVVAHKRYTAAGGRGKPVKALTKANCTEDEMFIFNYLEQKRQQGVFTEAKKEEADDVDEETGEILKPGEINDDEFDEYLDGFFGKKAKAAADAEDEEEAAELDFLKELGGELMAEAETKTKKGKKKAKAMDEDNESIEDIDADWGDDAEEDATFAGEDEMSEDETGSVDFDAEDGEDDSDGSISLDEGDDGEDDDEDEEEEGMSDEDGPPTSKKSRKQSGGIDGRSFASKLKHSDDMSSLFAAADDFAELLEETGKTKGHGTSNAVFNKDKSSTKQMKWEEKRRSNAKTYLKKGKAGGGGGGGGGKKRKR